MDKIEVELKDGTSFRFLKTNWDALSERQIQTILDFDAGNILKGWTKTTRRTIITLLVHLGVKFPERPYDLITISDLRNFLIHKNGASLNVCKVYSIFELVRG